MLTLLEEKMMTPLGPLWVICDEQFRLRAIEWEQYSERMVQLLDIHYRVKVIPASVQPILAVCATNLPTILPVISARSMRCPPPPAAPLFSGKSGKHCEPFLAVK